MHFADQSGVLKYIGLPPSLVGDTTRFQSLMSIYITV